MSKILQGIIGVLVVVAVVSVSAYALFTSQATITGMTLGVNTVGLQVGHGGQFFTSLNMANLGLGYGKLIPGEYDYGEFTLRNNTALQAERRDELDLMMNLTARLNTAGGDWGLLSEPIKAMIHLDKAGGNYTEYCNVANYVLNTERTRWHTLKEWNEEEIALPGGQLGPQEDRNFIVCFMLDEEAGNSLQGKQLTNMTITFTGTQATN